MMWKMIVIIWYVVITLVTFILYGVDKSKARHHRWRISEATLLVTALIGGGLGAGLGMLAFRHKTRHMKFCILVPLFTLLHIGLWVFLILSGTIAVN